MLDSLRPKSIRDAALEAGIDPFELVRLLVAQKVELDALHLSQTQLDEVIDNSGIETWWDSRRLPSDENSLRAAIRGALGQLVERELVGARTTRLDNLWRGLVIDQQVAIEQAIVMLMETGAVQTLSLIHI